jgi:hypothetical protein
MAEMAALAFLVVTPDRLLQMAAILHPHKPFF